MSPDNRSMPRVTALDALRGLVMIVMALDHVRDFFHVDALIFKPDDLSRTTVMLFLTRWITHFCAPVFMFAAGTSAYLWRENGRTAAELSLYLWKRGLWLVVLELTALRIALNFNPSTGPILLTVLWALGWSMVALAFLSRLPARILLWSSVSVIALHNLADQTPAMAPGSITLDVWKILHQQGIINIGGTAIVVGYPLIPWIAVMAAGFCFGQVLLMDAARRQRWLIRLGVGLTMGFICIRLLNVYGDPQPWSVQPSRVFTILSFLRCSKYPPSLDFLLMTLGPATLLLALFYRVNPRGSNPLVTIGRVPLFYFLAHMFLAHLLTIPFALIKYGRAMFLFQPPGNSYPPSYGYSLGTVYFIWLLVVAILYPVCLWFGRLKAKRTSRWAAYF